MGQKRTVMVVATLDTKGHEAAYVRDRIAEWGLETILADPGVLDSPSVKPDITREQIAQAAGTTVEALITGGKKGVAMAKQTEGLCRIVQDLYAQGRLDGIIALGGGQGTSIGTAAMRALPFGVPKLMLSPIASGRFQFGPYVGTKDICMMHAVTDILGLNVVSRPILRNAANAIAGMVLRLEAEPPADKPTIAVTMLGITTSCVMRIKEKLEALGYQLVIFHANGTSGPAMEQLIEEGKFVAVIDLSTHEIIDHQGDGLAGAPNRLSVLTRYAIPAIVSLGGNDYFLFETREKAPPEYQGRPIMVHNAQMTMFRPTPEEMRRSAREMIERLNRALGPTLVLLPLQGFSATNMVGREMWNPEGNAAMIDELTKGLRPEVPALKVDAHMNDPVVADLAVDSLLRLMAGDDPVAVAARHSGGTATAGGSG